MTADFHRLLARQYRACTKDGTVDLQSLLSAINASYFDYDRDVKRRARANALMAEELEEMFSIREAMLERTVRLEEVERAQAAITASESRIRHLAYHDSLTGLPNRELLSERLASALDNTNRNGTCFSLHLVDLDQLKTVNDTFGYQAGDDVLRHASEKLVALCRDADTIARLDGDEFVVVHLHSTRERAATLAERIVREMGMPVDLPVGQVRLGCSVGVTIIGSSSMGPLDCLRQADLALHKANRSGRCQVAFFEAAMDAATSTRRALETDLRDAVMNGGLEMYYQPQVNGAGEIFGAEALARWHHPERGTVPPMVFIPLAEETGIIADLGFFALRRAFQDCLRWPNITIAINVSAHQLRLRNFVSSVRELVRETGVAPEKVELEITESLLLGDDPATHETLHALSDLGFSISLDDFGTGYSSLSYLQKYPVDKIKIDRSFIVNIGVDPEATAVICAIVTLAQALHLRVIAEGVETTEQRTALLLAGCSDVQGFLTGRPMSAASFDELVAGGEKPVGSSFTVTEEPLHR